MKEARLWGRGGEDPCALQGECHETGVLFKVQSSTLTSDRTYLRGVTVAKSG